MSQNIPAGAENDPRAPWNQEDNIVRLISAKPNLRIGAIEIDTDKGKRYLFCEDVSVMDGDSEVDEWLLLDAFGDGDTVYVKVKTEKELTIIINDWDKLFEYE